MTFFFRIYAASYQGELFVQVVPHLRYDPVQATRNQLRQLTVLVKILKFNPKLSSIYVCSFMFNVQIKCDSLSQMSLIFARYCICATSIQKVGFQYHMSNKKFWVFTSRLLGSKTPWELPEFWLPAFKL